MNADDRPWGWGICASCGEDCDDEADYDETLRVSICPACRQNARIVPGPVELEVFLRR